MPDPVWAESALLPQPAVVPQPAPVRSSAHLAGQSIAELAQICREQAEELEGGPLIGKHARGACCTSASRALYGVLQPKRSSSST